jgi:hypothetical protein
MSNIRNAITAGVKSYRKYMGFFSPASAASLSENRQKEQSKQGELKELKEPKELNEPVKLEEQKKQKFELHFNTLINPDNYKIKVVTDDVPHPIKDHLYVKYNENSIEYTVLSPSGKAEKSNIIQEQMDEKYYPAPNSHEQILDLRVITHYRNIMNIAGANGHIKLQGCLNDSVIFNDNVSYFKMICQNSYNPLVMVAESALFFSSYNSLPLELYLSEPEILLPLFAGYILATYIYSLCLVYKPSRMDNVVTFSPFSQDAFDKMVINKYPEMIFNKDGNCFGHANMWYECLLEKKDYIKELNTMYETMKNNENITPIQSGLLKNISYMQHDAQKLRYTHYHHSFNESFYSLGNVIHYQRRRVIQMAVNYAVNRPNHLVLLVPFNITCRVGHAIGIASSIDGIISTFDPIFGEAKYKNPESAQISLSRLLAYKYGLSLFHLQLFFRGKCLSSFEKNEKKFDEQRTLTR